jgi:manganese transport protein
VIIVAMGVDATRALVMSQVVLSLILPVPMVALMVLIRRPALMGQFALGPRLQALALLGTGIVLVLNVILLLQTLSN